MLLISSVQGWATAESVQEQCAHEKHDSVALDLTVQHPHCDTTQTACDMLATSCHATPCVLTTAFLQADGLPRLAESASVYSFHISAYTSPPDYIPPIV